MTDLLQGTTATLVAEFFEYAGGPPQNITGAQITITQLSSGTVIVGPTSTGVTNPGTGVYVYNWSVPALQTVGSYLVSWTGTVDGDAVQATEVVLVTDYLATGGYNVSPCELWEPIWTCDVSLLSPVVTGAALRAATEVLSARTGFQFDRCQPVLRPCRRECALTANWWEWGQTPRPYMFNGVWYNVSCGNCSYNTCSCVALQEVMLPQSVSQIIEVKVNGIPLDPTAYRVDDFNKLVRLDGQLWPFCNDLTQDDTAFGTWSVTARFGTELPHLGRIAVGELAAEFAKALNCDEDCRLPRNVQSLTRQGVEIQLMDADSIFGERLGLYFSDMFIQTVNPYGIRERAKTYNLDRPAQRLVGY